MSHSQKNQQSHSNATAQKVRIDKWLWAARFFKTRSLAMEAIKGGKVGCAGQRVKPSKELQVGEQLTIRQGYAELIIIVKALSTVRGPAPQAALLYEETLESVQKREQLKALRMAQPTPRPAGQGRPTKRERRKIVEFTSKHE